MCGRYTLDTDKKQLEKFFDAPVKGFEEYGPNYNIAPTHTMPVLGQNRDVVLITSR